MQREYNTYPLHSKPYRNWAKLVTAIVTGTTFERMFGVLPTYIKDTGFPEVSSSINTILFVFLNYINMNSELIKNSSMKNNVKPDKVI